MTDQDKKCLSSIFAVNNEFIPLMDEDEAAFFDKEEILDQLPILPLRDMVLFPGMVLPITVGRPKSLNLIRLVNKGSKTFGVVAQKDAENDDPAFDDLYKTGTLAHILKILDMPGGELTVLIQGRRKVTLHEMVSDDPYFLATVSPIKPPQVSQLDETFSATMDTIKDICTQIYKKSGMSLADEASFALQNIKSPIMLLNYVASNLDLPVNKKQAFLENNNIEQLSKELLAILVEDLQKLELKADIQKKVRSEMDKQQREYMLHQQIKTIQEELGGNPNEKLYDDLKKRANKKKWPKYVKEVFEKEFARLQRMNAMSPDHGVQLNYVEMLVELPWDELSKDNLDVAKARQILDRDHYGMEKVKERILEYLSVLKLKGDMKSPILCLVGPPGVGKTSLGKSLAEAIGRKYIRMSLGGLRDEAEIRGHRRTYIGAMPGRIIQNLKKAQTSNPVFILDEIDKVIGANVNGDPTAALLEVLDPEQNTTFHDNYIDVDYDLSRILFVATANTISTIHPALLDRMELIEMSGYLIEEKMEIAKRHLIPKQLKEHGMTDDQLIFNDDILEFIIENYTRESGVRGLEKRIAKVMRHHATQIAEKREYEKILTKERINESLGVPIYQKERDFDYNIPGVANGLAWTAVGGEVLFVEAAKSKGEGKLTQTGNLGDVMKESSVIALAYIKSHAEELGLNADMLKTYNLHIHVPEGATPKDGPSAGVTMLIALASVLSEKQVRKGLAMTGEITLRGKVLPVGGVKEKILAAKRAGLNEIIISQENEKDISEIPDHYLEGVKFHYVKTMKEVLDIALEK
ncbi:MAG: endopeptidase La [Bacteroidales bacterium]|jgi:ATP-dependent Lon protease|nr:endopeptidase La [Bacteroidales bacterium]